MSTHAHRRGGQIAGIVLAAGAGSRFGAPKQLAPFRGRPLLEHALAAVARARLDRVVVVLGAEGDRIATEVPLHGADLVLCERWRDGQAASLGAGIGALGEVDAAVITLGDQPLVSAAAIERVVAARDPALAAIRATYANLPGHPVLLERALFARAARLEGDEGARRLLADAGVGEVACDGLGSPADVDTPEDLEDLERRAEAGSVKQ